MWTRQWVNKGQWSTANTQAMCTTQIPSHSHRANMSADLAPRLRTMQLSLAFHHAPDTITTPWRTPYAWQPHHKPCLLCIFNHGLPQHHPLSYKKDDLSLGGSNSSKEVTLLMSEWVCTIPLLFNKFAFLLTSTSAGCILIYKKTRTWAKSSWGYLWAQPGLLIPTA